MKTNEIRKILVLSTCHVTKRTADWLSSLDWEKEGPLGGTYGQYGWSMYAHDDNTCFPSAPHAPPGEFPPDLWAVFEKARSLGAYHVLFDCDADKVDGLQTWEW